MQNMEGNDPDVFKKLKEDPGWTEGMGKVGTICWDKQGISQAMEDLDAMERHHWITMVAEERELWHQTENIFWW